MNRFALAMLCTVAAQSAIFGQTRSTADTVLPAVNRLPASPAMLGKNIIKTNLSSLPFSNIHLQYERALNKQFSVALGLRVMPESDAPFRSQLEELVEDQDVEVGNIRLKGYAITPEVRWYPGKRGWMRGFYLAAYGRYANFEPTVPFRYSTTIAGVQSDKTALFGGPISSYSGGLMVGAQYTFGKVFTLDLWIVGAHYGASSGSLSFTTNPPLTPVERNSLQQALNNIESDFFTAKGVVNQDGSGGRIDLQGSWAGVRAAGINVGIRF